MVPPSQRPHIAIVESDEKAREELLDLMRAAGYRAAPYVSAESFLREGRADAFDFLIADVRLPGIGGLELVKVLRQMGDATPAVAIANTVSDALVEEALEAGAKCVLTKPVDARTLVFNIELALISK